ncbi:MAG: AAA family ATPase, partial [Thermoguttaceae bacterium]|nr:AAA family ATPase [Thermoguttaceae bacterium]
LLTRVLAAEFEAESLVAVVSPTRRIDAKSFWQQFLFSLRQTFCGCDETELRLMALDYLERSQRRRCVLLIDDAQNLPFRVFDELRSFIDQGAAAASQICVALFGTTVLEERLNLPPLYPFQQRIVSRSYLDAFERSEIADYIDAEARRVGGKFTFSNSAKRTVADLCKGSPRIANQLCDRAFFLTAQEKGASVEKREFDGNNGRDDWRADVSKRIATESVDVWEIDAPLVERAWAHLLNLPGEERKITSPGELSDVIEFGTLSDDEDDYNDDASFVGFNATDGVKVGESGELSKDVEVGEISGISQESGFAKFDAIDDEGEDETLEGKFDDETSENEEIDAALEARLLQNLKNWEGTNDEKESDGDAGTRDASEETNVVDRWERADALKERLNVDEWSEANGDRARTALPASIGEETENSEVDAVDEIAEVAGVGKVGENREISDTEKEGEVDATAPIDGVARISEENAAADVENAELATEKRVFEALKSEYFNDGFLFEIGDLGDLGSDGKKGTTDNKRKTSRKTTSKTRRPIAGDDDGSRLWN